MPDAPTQRFQGGACGVAGPASAPGSASGGPPGARRATSAGRAECETVGPGPPGPHLSHRRLSTARIPIATHRRRARMLAPTTALAERAGRCHSSEWGISRTGTTLAACQANMPSTCRGDACPRQVSSSPTVRQASMCTPHRRASNNTMATKPSRQVKITRQREVVRAAPSCSHFRSVDRRPAIAIRMTTTTSQANQAMNATSSDGADAGAVVRSMETRAIRTSAIAQ